MKKHLFIAIAAAGALASCTNDETLEVAAEAPRHAIGFDGFVGKSTKAVGPSFTKDNLQKFHVWGYENTSNNTNPFILFDAREVSKYSDAYTYSNLEYWTAGSSYWFSAIAPYDEKTVSYTPLSGTWPTTASGTGALAFNNELAAATHDLIYADRYVDNVPSGYDTPVALNFRHLLSRVDFRFENVFPNEQNIKFQISNVVIKDAVSEGRIAKVGSTDASWTITSDKRFDIPVVDGKSDPISPSGNFTTADKGYNYIIPDKAQFHIAYDVEVFWREGEPASVYHHEVETDPVDMKMGYSYTFVTSLSNGNVDPNGVVNPIMFTVESVGEWGE